MSATGTHVEWHSVPGYSGTDRREIVAALLKDCPWLGEFGLKVDATMERPFDPLMGTPHPKPSDETAKRARWQDAPPWVKRGGGKA